MPTTITMVCLADSRKIGAHCIAGKIVEGENKGQWIRPISAIDKCELANRDICYSNGQMPKLLDIVAITVKEHAPIHHQQENWIIDKSVPWRKEGELPVAQLSGLCDNMPTLIVDGKSNAQPILWVNGFSSTFGNNDKIWTAYVHQNIKSSLLLIQPQRMLYKVGKETFKRKVRAAFNFMGTAYIIAVTDNSAEEHYLAKPDGIYEENSSPVYYCVSLAEDYKGYCYKLIAGIMS